VWSRLIHTPRAHIRPRCELSPCRTWLRFADVMTSIAQAARAAAQLHEAAQEVARVAARRSGQPDAQMAAPSVPQRLNGFQRLNELRIPPIATHWKGSMTSQWPLHSFLELGALDGAVPSARLHARHVLREWGLAALADDTELVVSELVTNGVQASRAMMHAAIRLWLASDGTRVVVLVWDASPQPPMQVDADGDVENGRGLLLVEAVSEQWGWFPGDLASTSGGGYQGKAVWAIVGLPALRTEVASRVAASMWKEQHLR
jgi:anti-sigma regulatory factor (Ser/Thr protein kinase)